MPRRVNSQPKTASPRSTSESPPIFAPNARAARLLAALRMHYPDAHCALNYTTPHELLIATILSAQTTDIAVNKATPALFAAFPTPAHYARATPQEIEPFIRSIGLFRTKARALHEAMHAIVHTFGGQVPRTMDELLTLRGVARKTANVVLGNAFNLNEGFVVDTHIHRLAVRFGLAPRGTRVDAVERALMQAFPRESWCEASHMLIWHGRGPCTARGKRCSDHPICKEFGACCERRAHEKLQPSTTRSATRNTSQRTTPARIEKSEISKKPKSPKKKRGAPKGTPRKNAH